MNELGLSGSAVFWILLIWTIPWKGYALWKSARLKQKWWFIALLIINTAAILEIVYIFFLSKKSEAKGEPVVAAVSGNRNISFEDFQKFDLRVGKIVSVAAIEGTDRLVKLTVDTGGERTIVAGIGKEYSAEELAGKSIVVLTNLEPKKLMGVESQGMLLAADVGGKAVLLHPDKYTPAGSKVS